LNLNGIYGYLFQKKMLNVFGYGLHQVLLRHTIIKINMKKIVYGLSAIVALSLASCAGGEKMSEADIEKKVSELADAKITEETAKVTQDCEARMATEVKIKGDSLVANTPR
jgi:hypothetical protein